MPKANCSRTAEVPSTRLHDTPLSPATAREPSNQHPTAPSSSPALPLGVHRADYPHYTQEPQPQPRRTTTEEKIQLFIEKVEAILATLKDCIRSLQEKPSHPPVGTLDAMVRRLENTLALMKQTFAQLQSLHAMAASGPAHAAVRNTLSQRILNDHGTLQMLLNEYFPAVYHELLNVNAFEVAQQLASQMGSDTSA